MQKKQETRYLCVTIAQSGNNVNRYRHIYVISQFQDHQRLDRSPVPHPFFDA